MIPREVFMNMLIRRFLRYLNPSVEPKILQDMDRRCLRSIRIISLIVFVLEMGTFISFLIPRIGKLDHSAVVSLVSVGYCIVFCAVAFFLASKMLRSPRLPHSSFFIFRFFFFTAFTVWAIFADYRHYIVGEQMLTFYAVNLVMICFVLFKPWVGILLVCGAFAGLYLPMYLYDGAAGIQPLNFIVLALASVACNAIRYHVQISVSSQTIQLQENNAALEDTSRRDGLTGLLNRLALEEDAKKMDGRCMTIYMIDINYFKEFNDRYGHAAGDAILRQVSSALTHLYPCGHYYRYGGDEFLVITYRPPEENYGSDTYDIKQEQYDAKVLLSIGSARGKPASYQELFDLISSADKALYITKQRTHSAAFGGHDRRKRRE